MHELYWSKGDLFIIQRIVHNIDIVHCIWQCFKKFAYCEIRYLWPNLLLKICSSHMTGHNWLWIRCILFRFSFWKHFFPKLESSSISSGNMIVEFFSAAIVSLQRRNVFVPTWKLCFYCDIMMVLLLRRFRFLLSL